MRTIPVDSVIVNENGLAAAFEIVHETPSPADAWLRMRTFPVASVIVTENRVAAALKIVDKTDSPADDWFSKRAQSLLTR
jgi:hypothetical protein